jgi:transcriptional regulator with XRE-family HTH domain
MQIHKKIEQARLSAGLTQDELAEKLGIKRSTYQYWEKKTPHHDKIIKVAQALNLADDYFFGTNDESKDETNEDSMKYQEKYIALLENQMREKDETIKELRADLKEVKDRLFANSKKWEAYLQSLLALGHTQLDVLVEHRSQMEKKDAKKLKTAADTLYDAYQGQFLGKRS